RDAVGRSLDIGVADDHILGEVVLPDEAVRDDLRFVLAAADEAVDDQPVGRIVIDAVLLYVPGAEVLDHAGLRTGNWRVARGVEPPVSEAAARRAIHFVPGELANRD